MFKTSIVPVQIRSKSSTAKLFWRKNFKPIFRAFTRRLNEIPVSVLIWVPDRRSAIRFRLFEIKDGLEKLKIHVSYCVPEKAEAGGRAMMRELEEKGAECDIIVAVITDTAAVLNGLLHLSPATSAKLFIFLEKAFDQSIQEKQSISFKTLYERSQVFDAQNEKLHFLVVYCIKAVRLSKYLQSSFVQDKNITKSSLNLFSIYQEYKAQVDVLLNRGCLFFLSFLRFMADSNKKNLFSHIIMSESDFEADIAYFVETGMIHATADRYYLTNMGHHLFDMFNLASMPVLEEEKLSFKERWKQAIEGVFVSHFILMELNRSMNQTAKNYYFSRARQMPVSRYLRYAFKKHVFLWLNRREKEFLNHPVTSLMFDVWKENIAGFKTGWRPEERETVEFLEYMYEKLKIANDPRYGSLYKNYKDLAFNLSMLRPNTHAHIFLSYSFVQRPMKPYIKQYFNLSAITGQYDILLKRYPPYHNMLNLAVPSGQRTFFDLRGLDFRPITLRLDTKFTLALDVPRVQTRKNERYIQCPACRDEAGEREKEGEIRKYESELNSLFSSPAQMSQVDFGEDGKVYYTGGGDYKEAPMYGLHRAMYIQKQDELNLVRAIPRPGGECGLIIRFNLLDPVAVLLSGINRRRDLSLNEIRRVLMCLDLIGPEAGKPESERRNLNDIISEVFETSEPVGLTEPTLELLRTLEKLQLEDPSDDSAWRFLVFRLVEGKYNPLLQTICRRLMSEGFELVFSLWPLITGKEILMDAAGEITVKPLDPDKKTDGKIGRDKPDEAETREGGNQPEPSPEDEEIDEDELDQPEETSADREPEPESKKGRANQEKKYLLPLLDFLKRELQDLLKNLFSRYLDISAATKRTRSEPVLAQMVVQHCLNVKSDPEVFKKQLKAHLQNHYETHYSFLNEHLIEDGIPSVLKNIHKLGIEADKLIEEDIPGVMELITRTRNRLLSRGENNRLLAFIDPDSIDVQVGDFNYEGALLEDEEAYIIDKIKRQNELAYVTKRETLETRKREYEKEEAKKRKKAEIETMGINEEKERVEAETRKRVHQFKLDALKVEMNFLSAEALKKGNMKEWAALSLFKADLEGGMEKVESVMESSPNILMALSPKYYEMKEKIYFRRQIIEHYREIGEKLDPMTMSALFGENVKDVAYADFYKDMSNTLTETLKNTRYGQFPLFSSMTGGRGEIRELEKEDKEKPLPEED